MKRAALVALTLSVLATLALASALALLAGQRDEPGAPPSTVRPTPARTDGAGELGQLLRLDPAAGQAAPGPSAMVSTCPEELLSATDLVELDSQASSLVYRTMNRSVVLDDRTVMTAIALSGATGVALELEDITNYTIDRLEVCEFAVSTSATTPNSALLLNSSLRRVIVFETHIQHNASLDFDTALRAIALHGTGTPVDPYDVLTFSHEQRTQRKFDQIVDRDLDVIGLALRSIQPAAPKIESEEANFPAKPIEPQNASPGDPPTLGAAEPWQEDPDPEASGPPPSAAPSIQDVPPEEDRLLDSFLSPRAPVGT